MKATYDQVYALRLRFDPIFRRLPEWLWMTLWKVLLRTCGWTHDEWFDEFQARFLQQCIRSFDADLDETTRMVGFNGRRNLPS
jgi:hypothetical protein